MCYKNIYLTKKETVMQKMEQKDRNIYRTNPKTADDTKSTFSVITRM